MKDSPEEINQTYAPIYCALYPALCKIFQNRGYALAVHGSVARDFDLIAVPWADNPSPPESVIDEIQIAFSVAEIGKPETRNHGRQTHTISIGFGECSFDLSFFPASISRGEKCRWKQTCPDDNEWTGSCGESVGIETGQPFSYVQFKFCPNCGKQIEEVKDKI